MLTKYYQFFFLNAASYKPNKYSDFAKMKFFSDFQICNFPGYNRFMSILDNVDNDLYPIFESESSSGGMEIAKDICSNGCNCTSEHDTEFIQDIIDFEQ